MHELASWIISMVGRRLCSRAAAELENLALRHQLHVLRHQRPGRPRLFAIDRFVIRKMILMAAKDHAW